MKNELALPGYRQCEYLLILQPHEELKNKIMQVKKEFAAKFEAPQAEWGKPHIPLVKFTQLQMTEERLVNRLRMIAMAIPAFKVELKDYGSFPSHTIFINVDTMVAIQMLVKNLRSAQHLMKFSDLKPHFIEQSYIAVSRKLLPWQFEKAWLEYSHRHFTGRFIAKEMTLLRKPAGMQHFQIVQRFEFLNMPVVTTQGALF